MRFRFTKTHPAASRKAPRISLGVPPPGGRMFALEVKVPGGKHPVSAIQCHRLDQWAKAGAVAAVVESAGEALVAVGVAVTRR